MKPKETTPESEEQNVTNNTNNANILSNINIINIPQINNTPLNQNNTQNNSSNNTNGNTNNQDEYGLNGTLLFLPSTVHYSTLNERNIFSSVLNSVGGIFSNIAGPAINSLFSSEEIKA